MDKQPVIKVGGDVESALKGQYRINPRAVIKEAWLHTLSSRKNINFGLTIALSIGIFTTLLLSPFFGGMENVQKSPEAYLILEFVITVVLAPIFAALSMMGVYGAVGLKTNAKFTFSFLNKTSVLALCAIISKFMIFVGMNLFLFPGLYLFIMLSLAAPLILDKGLSPLKAIKISLQATRFQWLQICAIYFFIFFTVVAIFTPLFYLSQTGAGLIALILFAFALSYIVPMYYYVKGIIYREMFGLKLLTSDNIDKDEGTFIA